jgi:2'-5' RNA ligase
VSDAESEDEYGHVAGDTILLVSLPDLDAVAEPWLHASTSDGVDAHVTVLVPFLPEGRIDEGVLAELRRVFAGHRAFDLTFSRIGRFPETLYLVPEPPEPLIALTAAVYERWPECPPYEGRFPDPVPHLTVVHAKGDDVYEHAGRVLQERLPVHTRATGVDLLCFDGRRWNLRERFPLAENQES